ncbi:MAG: TolC family protein [Phycisphaerales bacterium]|nr:MAG: TolC family protein [Phycisphaerales bacterium]
MKRNSSRIATLTLIVMATVPSLAGPAAWAAGSTSSASTDAEDAVLPELSDESPLSDYLEYAALNNPELEAAFNRWKAALEKVPQAKSWPDPRFSYRYFIREIETRVGPQRQAFEISQTFPWFGKLDLAGDVAMEAARAAQQRYEAVRLRLFFEVKDAYYEYYYLARSIAVTRENVELLTHLESVVRTRYRTAAGSHPDVIRAQVELGKLEDQLNSLTDLRGPVIARLNAALNRPIEVELSAPQQFTSSRVSVNDRALLARLEQANPQVNALAHEVEGYRQAAILARKEYTPDISLGLSYVDVARSHRASQFSDNGKDAVGAMISLNIPLWRGKYSASVREARMKRRAALHEKMDATNRLKSELKMALYQFRDAQRKMDLYGEALVPKAIEAVKVAEQSFQTGSASFLDLIDAQRTYLEFQLAHERARADHEQSLARIEMLIGGDVEFADRSGPAEH